MTGTDIDIRDDAAQPIASATLFGSDNPAEALERMAVVARTLADVVRAQNLVVRIGQSDHVRVEGWTFCGSLLGVFPIVEWTRPMIEGDQQVGWEARVEARTRSGELVGSGEAECLRSERTWKGRDDYALRSMAQTRAVSKALRMPLGFVMQLAGFNPTPAEEMPAVEHERGSSWFPPEDEPETWAAGSSPGDDPLRHQPPATQSGPEATPSTAHPSGPDQIEQATDPQKRKLDVLVAKLRTPGHITTEHLYRAVDPDGEAGWPRDEDGELHWSGLRETLSKEEASDLIERLIALEQKVAA